MNSINKLYRITYISQELTEDNFALGALGYPFLAMEEARPNLVSDSFAGLVALAHIYITNKTNLQFTQFEMGNCNLPQDLQSNVFEISTSSTDSDGIAASSDEKQKFALGEINLFISDFSFAFEIVQKFNLIESDIEGLTRD